MHTTAIIHASSLATPVSPDGSPKTGEDMGKIRVIEDGGVLIEKGRIVYVGSTREMLSSYDMPPEPCIIDARSMTIVPGFVDPHTHLVYAGSREKEFAMRLRGAKYMDILKAGGGILNTVRSTRTATEDQLYVETRKRCKRMLEHGTTTLEAKTGYGLELDSEMKCLRVLKRLANEPGPDIVPTFMGAHAFPPEYKEKSDYVDAVIDMLPMVASSNLARFCDVFCEEGVFSVDDARRILSKAKELGMGIRLHADEMEYIGASELAADMMASSADHLVATPHEAMDAMAAAGTAAVLLPGTPFVLMDHRYPRARDMIDRGVAVALATDMNPNCNTESMQMAASLACYEMKMTPEEVLTAMTLNSAYSLGLSGDRGTLEAGKRGDLVLLDIPGPGHIGHHFGVNLARMVMVSGEVLWSSLGPRPFL